MSSGSEDPNSLRNEVFSRLFDENWAAVRHHIECVVDDDAEVTELVSEVFVTAWAQLRPGHPLGRPWLLRIADRRLRRQWRGIADRPAVTEAVHLAVMAGEPDGSLCHRDFLRALSGLRVRERRIIMLTYWDGLTVGEIVESMRISRSRADRIFRRAQEKLRAALELEGASGDADH